MQQSCWPGSASLTIPPSHPVLPATGKHCTLQDRVSSDDTTRDVIENRANEPDVTRKNVPRDAFMASLRPVPDAVGHRAT